MSRPPERIEIDYPDWVDGLVDWDRPLTSDEECMRLAVDLSRENVERQTGGPFGAAIFEADSGRLVAVGVNSVLRLDNCTLHAEMLAFMMAQHRARSFTLGAPGMPRHELFTSCEPCAMCLGATLWSGVSRVVYGARGSDVRDLGFDEGPVFEQSHAYLATRGIRIEGGLLRDEAVAVLTRYRDLGGPLYNGMPAV